MPVNMKNKKTNGNTFGERIRFLRKAFGLTQDEFAARAGVAKQTLLRYEKGQRPPAADFLEAVCRVYFADGTWLLTGNGEPFVIEGNLKESHGRDSRFKLAGNKDDSAGAAGEKAAGQAAAEFIHMAEYLGRFARIIGANPARGRAFEELMEKFINSNSGNNYES